jgi:hypothetical protein
MTRRTYLIPPPSAVAGIFGAVLGLNRAKLVELSKDMLAGAELRSLNGRITTLARIFKFDRPASQLLTLIRKYYEASYKNREDREKVMKDIEGLLTIKESEELYMPEYKFAVASNNEPLLEEGMRRLRDFDFEYEIFGGNDYHFVEFVGDPRPARVYNSREGYGYCPREDFERLETDSFNIVYDISAVEGTKYPVILPVTFLANVKADYIQVYGAKIIASRELAIIDDGESKIFVYEVNPFLVAQI